MIDYAVGVRRIAVASSGAASAFNAKVNHLRKTDLALYSLITVLELCRTVHGV
jgi:hypothetical protein